MKNKKLSDKDLKDMQYWYMRRRLKFIQEMIDLVYSNQDILKSCESMLFDLYCSEEKELVGCYTPKRNLDRYFEKTKFTAEMIEYMCKKDTHKAKIR